MMRVVPLVLCACVASGCDGRYVVVSDDRPVPHCWDFDTRLGPVGADDHDLVGFSVSEVAAVVAAHPDRDVEWRFAFPELDPPLDPVVGLDVDLDLGGAFAVDRSVPPGVWHTGFLENSKCLEGRLLRIPAVATITFVYDGVPWSSSTEVGLEAGAADPALIGFSISYDILEDDLEDLDDAWTEFIREGLRRKDKVYDAGGSLNGSLARGYLDFGRTRAYVSESLAMGEWGQAE